MEFTVGDEVAKVAEAEAAGASTAEEAEQWNDLARRSAISTLRATVAPAIDVVHELFSKIGTPQTYEPDAVLIPESSAPGAPRAMYITNGLCSIRRGSKEVGNAGPGDLVGEMRMLLGDASNVAVVADTEVETIEAPHEALIQELASQPAMASRVFKTIAVQVSERIAETSAMARDEVQVAKGATASRARQKKRRALEGLTTEQAEQWRRTFKLDVGAAFCYQCGVSMVREENAKKETDVQFGDLFVFDTHLCFNWKVFGFTNQEAIPFKEIVALLHEKRRPTMVTVELKSHSYELCLPEETAEEGRAVMEQCRMTAIAHAQSEALLAGAPAGSASAIDASVSSLFQAAVAKPKTNRTNHRTSAAIALELTADDWALFLKGAKQLSFKRGEYVLREGVETHALYQILKGSLRVELQLQGQATAVVVGHRGAGEMFGETSLLKASPATASIAVDTEEAILVCVEGSYVETLFESNPALPGRFFAYLASYQAERLRRLSETFSTTSGGAVTTSREIAVLGREQIGIDEVFANAAYRGVLRHGEDVARRNVYKGALSAFDFVCDVWETFQREPDKSALQAAATRIRERYIRDKAPRSLRFLTPNQRKALADKAKAVAEAQQVKLKPKATRSLFDEAVGGAISSIARHCFSEFLASDHFPYILELKAKEGIVPNVPDFRPLRVLGEGGFGQVLEVVKRDCGKQYAMKVMEKRSLSRILGQSWRQKIHLEKELMASLHHPFLVNLLYAFQNIEFLVLVMDLVPAGDLSDFVLTEKRLTPQQVRFVMMEVVCVIGYCHSQGVLYRDLKPENLLIDEQGHVRLIDMGLAVRITKERPRRMSRVGTECYMAPEVRWASKRNQPYGVSADWYTVGVLLYEFSAGDTPYAEPEADKPKFRPHKFPDRETEDFVRRLVEQDCTKRLGCGSKGISEVHNHPFWRDVEWDLVPLRKIASPCKGVKGPRKAKERREAQAAAVEIAGELADVSIDSSAPGDDDRRIDDWEFVSPNAVVEEYMENMFRSLASMDAGMDPGTYRV